MSNMFSPPSPPAEDPAIAAERAAQEQRAEGDRIKSIQEQLNTETQFKSGGFGSQSLLGGLIASVLKSGKTSLLGSG